MTTTGGRIPESLKAVFTASNQGKEVYVPPKDCSASKIFRRNCSGDGNSILSKPQYACFRTRNFGHVSPQALFHLKLKESGYFPRNFSAKRSGYHNAPTEHQLASYGSAIIDVVKRNSPTELRHMLEAGLSPNACNQHGESILHMTCRHGKVDLFRVLIAFDVDLQQTDDHGRTCFTDCCWAAQPSFEIASWLLKVDRDFLFLYDVRGSLPLSYVTKANWQAWRSFLEEEIDTFFPQTGDKKYDGVPFLCTLKPNCRPVPDPKDTAPSSVAKLVASGEITPHQAMVALAEADDESTIACSEYMSSSDEYDSDDSSFIDESDFDSGCDSDFDSDEEDELYKIVGGIGKAGLCTIEE